MAKELMPVIGKDVIESLTIGMYEDSRFIFREYIQNSADQIDKAIRDKLISKVEGEIHIEIDPENRRIVIEDNATGIATLQVATILQNIAQSTKRRGIDKGFRGIGRLGGLAYSEKLIFETSFKGEAVKTILTWDAAMLKDIINNRLEKEDAVSVIQQVTSLATEKEEIQSHFFKVILDGVTNDDLLAKKEIQKYMSMVAPLPFPTQFIFKSKIYEEASKDKFDLDEYRIYLDTEQVFKGYSTSIFKGDESNKTKEDEVIDIVFFKEYASDGKLLLWGWHSISEKNQSLNKINYTRGFRLRKDNIQIGDENTLLKLQRDRRFHFYFFGEVYGVHSELIPNSRRDYFIENDIFFEFEQKLKQYFHTEIYNLCYTASEINSSLKKIEGLKNFEQDFRQKQETGFTNKIEHQEYREQLVLKREEAEKAKKKIEKIDQDADNSSFNPVKKILTHVIKPDVENDTRLIELDEEKNQKPKLRTDNLSSLNKEQRKFLGRIFTIIRDVLDPDMAEGLIQKIEEELK